MPLMIEPPKKGTPQHRIYKMILWALTAFMLASGIIFLPSVPSVPMIAFACVSAPLERVEGFWRTLRVTGPVKALVLLILFALSVSFFARFGVGR